MKAIVVDKPGDESVLAVGDVPDPIPGPGQILIRVRYASLNRADLLQREGRYPPPPGASEVIGLDCAGEVAALGPGVNGFRSGERVMALLPGGGYAEKAVAHVGSVMRVPQVLSDAEAAAIPEVYLTGFLNLFLIGGVRPRDSALVHGGGSGVGTAAIQLLKEAGARSIVTAGTDAKCARCREFGADVAINYAAGPFAPKVIEATGGRGAAVILDIVGAPYLEQNLEALAHGGRLILVSLLRGARGEIDLSRVQRRHARIIGSTLRSRAAEEKAEIVAVFIKRFGGALGAGRLRPAIHQVIPLAEAPAAHRMMQASEHFGKIVLQMP